jgi:amidase
MRDDFAQLDATAQAALVRSGKAAPRELVDAAIARIERLDPQIGAVVLPVFERARQRAREAEKDRTRLAALPFAGVPFLMKDLGGEEAATPCYRGMRLLKEACWQEPMDSYFTQKVRAAGLISLGRTNTPELGLLPTTEPQSYGPTRNPWNLAYSAGGSSGGAAAAVASGMVPMAHASDGGGSIRIPAAHCGLVGLKPTRARSSFGPGAGERWAGFSCELVVSRTVRDTAAFLDATHGPMPGDPYYAAPPARSYASMAGERPVPLRIGFLAHSPRSDLALHPDCIAAVEATARTLERLGHHVEPSYPEALADPENIRAYVNIVSCCIARALDAIGEKLGRSVTAADVEPLTWAVAELGRSSSASQYLSAVEGSHALGRRFAAWWQQGFDLLLTPTTGRPAPRIGELVSPPDQPLQAFLRAAPFGLFTSVFNQSGQPAISLPMHWTADGLPVGAQLVAAYGREDVLLQVATQLEMARPWSDRVAPIHA